MRIILGIAIGLVLVLSFSFFYPGDKANVAVVKVIKDKQGFKLYRNNEPYFIKGAGGYAYYDKLNSYGGNSVRLWTTEGAEKYLDEAQRLGLSVTLGLDMALERHGFDYNNKKNVAEQLERLKKEVLRLKDHPALLMWGVGNEVDQFAKNYNVWNAVNDLAGYIHKVDPAHPTTTMLAGVPKKHIAEIVKRCPNLDVLSINAFRELPYIKNKIAEAGWTGPYLIGEWGASGYWETEKTPWGAFLEETSTEKAEVCKMRYEQAVGNENDKCIGSYVFYWGYKQARTHTLLSLFLESGEEIGVIDVLQKLWTGKTPSNSAPLIKPVGIDDKMTSAGAYLSPGSLHAAYTDAEDPDKDPLLYKWEIFHESQEKKEGGDKENKPGAVSDLILDGSGKQLSFKAPATEGAYRLFVYVFDGRNHVATANAPFYVRN
ncbi:MAG: glycoside hydrolase family 2 TIM barrel-domain containing protein [Bacteroidia bacterium]